MTRQNDNHQRLDYYAAAPAQAKALGALHSAVMQSSLPDELIELVFLRVSQINGCAYCIALHTRALAKAGVAHEKMALTAAWREAGDAFDARERAAFAFADSLTRIEATGAPDEDYALVEQQFSDQERAELGIAIATMNAFNRLAIGFRLPIPAQRGG